MSSPGPANPPTTDHRPPATPRAAIVLAAIWLLSVVFWLEPGFLRPDGAGYYVYMPSTWLDHDLLFFDDWEEFGLVRNGIALFKDVTVTAHLGNHWPSGSSLLWYPAFVAADAIRPLLPREFPRNGLSLPYNTAVVMTSALVALAALLVSLRIARTYVTPYAAAVAAIGAWLGTPLLWYSVAHATMSHTASALACALVFAGTLALREHRDAPTAALTGLAAGFAFAVRPQDALFAAVPFLAASLGRERRLLAPYAAGLLIGAAPQLVVSSFLYGSPWGSLTGGAHAEPFVAFQRIWTWEPLFSWYHGLFPWTPFAALGLAGLAILWRRDRALAITCLAMFAGQWLVNATLERTFWGAVSFGQRRFTDCTVIFVLGAAVLLDRLGRRAGTALVAATSLWTLSIFFAARRGLDLRTYLTPSELFAAQLDALRTAATQFVPLEAVPPPMRGTVALSALAALALFAAIAAIVLRLSRRQLAFVAGGYLAVMTFFFVWCGLHDRERIPRHEALIRRNLPLAALPGGGTDDRLGMLRDELTYLQKSGRTEEAARLAVHVRELELRRAEMLRRLGLP